MRWLLKEKIGCAFCITLFLQVLCVFASMHVCELHEHMVSTKSKEGTGYPGSGITGVCV